MLGKLTVYITLAVSGLAGVASVQGQTAAFIQGQPAASRSFSGAINSRYAIRMSLTIEGSKITGSYYYVKVGKPITLRGSIDSSGTVRLEELDQTGKPTGIFKGRLVADSEITGTWSKPDGSGPMPFAVKGVASSENREATPGGVQITEKRVAITRGRK